MKQHAFIILGVLLSGQFLCASQAAADAIPDEVRDTVQARDNVSGQIVSYGLYEKLDAANAPAAKGPAPGFKHAARVTTFAASQCMRFGYRFALEGLPVKKGKQEDRIDIIVRHPPMLDDEGNARIVSTARIRIQPTAGRFENFLIYTLRKPREMLPGKWQLEVHRQGRMLVSKTFNLLKGQPADPERVCD